MLNKLFVTILNNEISKNWAIGFILIAIFIVILLILAIFIIRKIKLKQQQEWSESFFIKSSSKNDKKFWINFTIICCYLTGVVLSITFLIIGIIALV
ncbi:B-cell receptor-associated 31-like family protein [Mycoplasma feriruminatoris]|uniref:B-cell receptor-associated 31-like family protein n=1 Tax=Mycoplasma feriruminatoris TaxID=1179777 RepID=UPI0002A4FB44|nr:B-cell receptor-associated 31-like family protein [Mycoplasma feriruminatoris]UKS54314.1 B-cell receptor-associated 31-like familyprotein [Mycoplasma feriruminatoris]WFQ90367.1 hypothetical protein MFERI11561_00621 [Mycoplasma feriruminatoris]WFQ91191.1 hypothetical protein MFERI13461_00628 [Mycoplasma feriruminatoris]WFQ94538.1 hypothetical protein MFERI15220_00619 [Mycoplasma feriruminatoris]VZK65492.1 hypothetical protein MF5292_00669 [Mycoplasma feriruminatoris]